MRSASMPSTLDAPRRARLSRRVGLRKHAHQSEDRLGQRASRGQLRLQIPEFGARRQPAVPEQETDFLERRVLRRARGCRSPQYASTPWSPSR